LRKRLIRYQSAAEQNRTLKASLHYISGPRIPRDFRPVTAEIISKPPSEFEQRVVVAAGSANGIHEDDPVVTADGLVGKVTKVASHQAQVTLLTDEDTAVSAIDIDTRAEGVVKHGHGPGSNLFLDLVPKAERVVRNNRIVTAGWHQGQLSSIYPKGIPIGIVSSASFPSTDLYASVQVTPYVDFSALDSVIVLVKKT
jgi:rod shape-determining protein MreC